MICIYLFENIYIYICIYIYEISPVFISTELSNYLCETSVCGWFETSKVDTGLNAFVPPKKGRFRLFHHVVLPLSVVHFHP